MTSEPDLLVPIVFDKVQCLCLPSGIGWREHKSEQDIVYRVRAGRGEPIHCLCDSIICEQGRQREIDDTGSGERDSFDHSSIENESVHV